MAAGAAQAYVKGLLHIARGEADFLGGTVKAALLDNAHTPDLANHEVFGDVSGDEIADGDYAQLTLSGKTITVDENGHVKFDAADLNFGDDVSISARYLVIYVDRTTEAEDYLLWLIDLNDGGSANVSSTESDFDIAFNAAGIYTIDPSA